MADLPIFQLNLKPVFYAYHHGYRVVAVDESLSKDVIEQLAFGKYQLYFTNRRLDEKYCPYKYRFFQINADQPCYVFARSEIRDDTSSDRGIASATQFYVLEGKDAEILTQANGPSPAQIMAKIGFRDMDVSSLERNQVDRLPSGNTKISFSADDLSNEFVRLESQIFTNTFRNMLEERVFEALEMGNKIFFTSKTPDFEHPVKLFNDYGRILLSAMIRPYRNKLSLSTGELTTDLHDYDVVFLHGKADHTVKGPQSVIIDLDEPHPKSNTEKSFFWYLSESHMVYLSESHDFLSSFVSPESKGPRGIQNLEGYFNFRQKSPDTIQKLSSFFYSGEREKWKNTLHCWNGEALVEDLLKIYSGVDQASFSDREARGVAYYFYFMLQLSTKASGRDFSQWPELLQKELRDVVIHILGTFYKKRLKEVTEIFRGLAVGDDSLSIMIVEKMIQEDSGLCIIDIKGPQQVNWTLDLWIDFVHAIGDKLSRSLLKSIWEDFFGKYLIEVRDKINYPGTNLFEENFSSRLKDLCVLIFSKICQRPEEARIHILETRNSFRELYLLSLKRFSSFKWNMTFDLLFLDYIGNNEGRLTTKDFDSDNYHIFIRLEQDIERFLERILTSFVSNDHPGNASDSSSRYRYLTKDYDNKVYELVRQLTSVLLKHPVEGLFKNFQYLIYSNFLFPHQKVYARYDYYRHILSSVSLGLGSNHDLFPTLKIQKELYNNLGIRSEQRIYLLKGKKAITIGKPEFDSSFDRLRPNLKKYFFDCLLGFIQVPQNDTQLKSRLLLCLWTYLSADDTISGDVRYRKFLQWLCPVNSSRGWVSKNSSLFGRKQLIRGFEQSAKKYNESIVVIPLRRAIGEQRMEKDAFGFEDLLGQIAIAAGSSDRRITDFILFLDRLLSKEDEVLASLGIVLKYISNRQQRTWKDFIRMYRVGNLSIDNK